MKLILVRHGQTDDNVQQVMQGEPGAPLNEVGLEQAQRVAERFADEEIDALVSSPISRAMATAMIVAKKHRHLNPIPMPLLRERTAGQTTGLTYEEFGALSEADPGGHIGFRPVGGESMIDLSQRARFWHATMLEQFYGQTVLVVTHGGWLRGYLGWLQHGVLDERSWDFRHNNTGVSVVDLFGQRPKILLVNDLAHLDSA